MHVRFGGSVIKLRGKTLVILAAILFMGCFVAIRQISHDSRFNPEEDPLHNPRYRGDPGELNFNRRIIREITANGQAPFPEPMIGDLGGNSDNSSHVKTLFGYRAAQNPDHMARQRKKPRRTVREKMAMDAARGYYSNILSAQKKILKDQVRPPDTRYNINVTLSDQISMDRTIEDTRPRICRSFNYDSSKLPAATVVIPFFNEALSMLLRTVHSILNRTPDHLLDGVILVDDRSTSEYLQVGTVFLPGV